MLATGTVASTSWEETPFAEYAAGSKSTRATVGNHYSGTIEGAAALEYLMFYTEGSVAHFVGLERIVGSVAGREGRFVLEHIGAWVAGVVRTNVRVLPASGTGELSGINGQGSLIWDGQHGDPSRYTLDLEFD